MQKKEIRTTINSLIENCPPNWAELTAKELHISLDAVYKRINRVKNPLLLIEIIDTLKLIQKNYQNTIEKAFRK